jgi:hypothetical protein
MEMPVVLVALAPLYLAQVAVVETLLCQPPMPPEVRVGQQRLLAYATLSLQLVAVVELLQAVLLRTNLLGAALLVGFLRLVMAATLFQLQAILITVQPEEQDGAEMGLV